ncbi:uncharacterized protein B0I36DRAFT_429189 [Microdochium trichocladiopsis]|uniref:Uncharacterized protein n=1 Tax=Microdochium trichocladiopsis TaxID=1682393 RepID=A0A9P9BSL8_9PEZI|nr:uncharacterized protein B0I36DRAFT_429189 [Microdochium trichocladiopsis]KAH7034950.1 hypothetical protein B0I36DRAFT_429189 [Microdochium trichocladiopsis]
MDHQRLPRRCASHGSLGRGHASNRRPAHSLSIRRPLHKPLRAVNENSILLPSPGALEGMLKTTTETGDIGMWTIKPVLPSSKRKESISYMTRPLPFQENSFLNDGAKWNETRGLNRSQTTSEAQSLYTSGSQKSVNSTLPSTSTVEHGHRSFSMTTCGSRHLPHQASSLTMKTQASSLQLQRPRSPFPYPTRLRRPGVRPASPALTETGLVDYSRMVEIDRISSRTEHGSFRSIDPTRSCNRVPLGLRTEVNGSTPPLQDRGIFTDDRALRAPYPRTMSAASIASWNARNRFHTQPVEPRAFSLTSAAQIPPHFDRKVTPVTSPQPTSSTADARYYDYTEDFEKREPGSESATSRRLTNFYPVGRDARGVQRLSAYELDQDTEDRQSHFSTAKSQIPGSEIPKPLDDAPSHTHARPASLSSLAEQDDNNEQGMTCKGWHAMPNTLRQEPVFRVNDIDLLPSQLARSSIDTFDPNMDMDSRDMPLFSYSCYRPSTVQQTHACALSRQVQVRTRSTPTIHNEQGVIVGDETGEDSDYQDSTGDDSGAAPLNCQTSSGYMLKPQVTPALPDGGPSSDAPTGGQNGYSELTTESRQSPRVVAANVASPTDPINVMGQGDQGLCPESTERRCRIPRSMTEPGPLNHKGSNVVLADAMDSSTVHSVLVSTFGHKRGRGNFARISDPLPTKACIDGSDSVSLSCTPIALVQPKPISASRQLKVKNSIPHLMKALPPAPGCDQASTSPDPAFSDNGESSEVLKPYKCTSTVVARSQDGPEQDPASNLGNSHAGHPRTGHPKLRLKMRLSPTPSAIDNGMPANSSSSRAAHKPPQRLRLRSSPSSRKSTSRDDTTEHAAISAYVMRPAQILGNGQPKGSGDGIQVPLTIKASQEVYERPVKQNACPGTAEIWDSGSAVHDASLPNKTALKLKNRMLSVLRWLDETHDPRSSDIMTATESLQTEQSLRCKNESVKNLGINGGISQAGPPDLRWPHKSLRKVVRARIVRLIEDAKGAVRGRIKRRACDV